MPGIKASKGTVAPHPHEDEIGAGAPDPAKCEARTIMRGEPPAWCLAPGGRDCRFSQPFGDALLCCHPQRDAIVARKWKASRS
jgi:hypothetical protein